jgi:hypothetical protein
MFKSWRAIEMPDVARAVAAGVLQDRLQDPFGEVAVEADAQPLARFGDLEVEPPL